jgi:hypothetical protein
VRCRTYLSIGHTHTEIRVRVVVVDRVLPNKTSLRLLFNSTTTISNMSLTSLSIYSEAYPPPWRPLLILVFPLLPIFWKYRVDITDTTLKFGYSCAFTTVDRNHFSNPRRSYQRIKKLGWLGYSVQFER